MIKACVFVIASWFFLSGCSFFYVMKQGVYQIKLLADAEPIEIALRKKHLDKTSRKKLELVLDIRQFSQERLKLKGERNYQDVNLDWDHTIHTVSASAPLKFEPYLWWFPITGSVPYKGFFEETDAILEEKVLIAQGFDTQRRAIAGYSTLGFFNDPVWPAMLTMNDFALIELIIHELSHATVYLPNQTPFNETFANFVGKKGTVLYIENRFGRNSDEMKQLKAYYRRAKLYQEFFHNLYGELDNLYNSDINNDEKMNEKISSIQKAKIKYEKLMKDEQIGNIDWSLVNNAYLLSFKSYNQDDEIFQELLDVVSNDFGRFIDEVNYFCRTSTPFLSLRLRIDELVKK